jgi:hypothetical protein
LVCVLLTVWTAGALAARAGEPGPTQTVCVAITPPPWAAGPRTVTNLARGARVTVTSTHAGLPGEDGAAALVDGNLATRWSSLYAEPQRVTIQWARPVDLGAIRLYWENACATRYAVSVSPDGKAWRAIHLYLNADAKPEPRMDMIDARGQKAKAIQLDLSARVSTNWGFSLYEIAVGR